MNFTSRSVQSGCSLSTINYVGIMLITAHTVANLVSNLNVNSDNNDNNNNDNNNNNNNDNMNTNMNGKRSFDSRQGVNELGKLHRDEIQLSIIQLHSGKDPFSKESMSFILDNTISIGKLGCSCHNIKNEQ